MTAVIKAIGILLLQIIIYYLFGTIFELFCRKKHGVVFKEISGFLVYQVLFQICALPMIKADQTLARLAVLWGVIVITCCIGTAIFCRERIAEDIAMIIKAFFRHKIWFLLMGCFLFAMCYYVSINGEMNDDSTYYIGLINTTLTSGRLYKFNAYTGEQVHSLYLRRALVTFDINTAVACKIYHIHPLVITRITRASLNMILTAGAVYLIGRNFFRKRRMHSGRQEHLPVLPWHAISFLIIRFIQVRLFCYTELMREKHMREICCCFLQSICVYYISGREINGVASI